MHSTFYLILSRKKCHWHTTVAFRVNKQALSFSKTTAVLSPLKTHFLASGIKHTLTMLFQFNKHILGKGKYFILLTVHIESKSFQMLTSVDQGQCLYTSVTQLWFIVSDFYYRFVSEFEKGT